MSNLTNDELDRAEQAGNNGTIPRNPSTSTSDAHGMRTRRSGVGGSDGSSQSATTHGIPRAEDVDLITNEESLPRVDTGAAPIEAEPEGAPDDNESARQARDKRPAQQQPTERPTDVNYFEELAELRRQLAESADRERQYQERERQLLERERPDRDQDPSNHPRQDRIRAIRKPPGEAGDAVNGFNLQEAMGLDANEDQNDQYNDFLRTLRENCPRAGITFARTYSGQDPAALAKLFKLNRRAIPYLTRERFPNDWAQVEALKQYIRNKRREENRRRKLALKRQQASLGGDAPSEPEPPKRRRPAAKRAPLRYSDETDMNGAGPSRKRPCRRRDDDDDDEEDGNSSSDNDEDGD